MLPGPPESKGLRIVGSPDAIGSSAPVLMVGRVRLQAAEQVA